MSVKVKVDTKQVENLGFDFRQMATVGLNRMLERGTVLLRREVPKVTHNLEQGVSVGEVNTQGSPMTGELVVAARAGRTAVEGGLLHLPGGETREISLRARPAYDYAKAVAKGTGVYRTDGEFGPQQVIRPRNAKAMLIPVDAVPIGKGGKPESYITSGGQIYILRRFSKGRRPNPYDERAAQQLDADAPNIWDAVVTAFANQETAH
jgi:hypothetical protein